MAEPDKSLAAVVSIAQTLLKAEEGRVSITPDVIAEKVKLAASTLSGIYPGGVDQDAACVELVRRFSHWIVLNSVQNFPDFRGKQRPKVSTLGCATIRRFCRGIWSVINASHSRDPAPSPSQPREHQRHCA
ncbi:hypothetical protein [Rhodoferax sp.]|uniref:hypothetical protein n=1 Tax=Rhodoferax sp. TaxID=50421 RepID=UPI00273278CA|nr:hypothetical protein [Rhodoferax sp.]MDP3191516.1 hypothetical protein [Rhodoferax sp.]